MPSPPPSFTIDFVVHILSTAVFAPLPAFLLPITLLARGTSTDSFAFGASVVYFGVICTLRILQYLDQRIAYGRPRQIDWEDEVIVITGGAGGLGGLIAEIYGMRGVPVAVLDIKPRDEGLVTEMDAKGIEYYQCDVGDADQVAATAARIEAELGPVTILINNAAVVHGGALLNLSASEIENTCRVNVLAHFFTVKQFLTGMLERRNGGTIVTISSVLGHLGCAGLASYTSSKAAVTAMHKSLVAELHLMTSSSTTSSSAAANQGRVNTILVEPGQLTTALFADITPPSEFLGPPVSPAQLAARIVAAIDAGASAEIAEPLYARWISVMDVFPAGLKRVARTMAGLDRAAWDAYVDADVTKSAHHQAQQNHNNDGEEEHRPRRVRGETLAPAKKDE